MPTAEGREFGDSWGKGQVQAGSVFWWQCAAPPACLQQRNNKPLTSTVGNNLNLLKIFPGSLALFRSSTMLILLAYAIGDDLAATFVE
jgi:hypothetical protein